MAISQQVLKSSIFIAFVKQQLHFLFCKAGDCSLTLIHKTQRFFLLAIQMNFCQCNITYATRHCLKKLTLKSDFITFIDYIIHLKNIKNKKYKQTSFNALKILNKIRISIFYDFLIQFGTYFQILVLNIGYQNDDFR